MKTLCILLLTTLCALAIRSEAAERAPRPNIVLIFADDLGYGDVGYQGCPDVPTPHIDQLAKQGVQFSCGYVSAPVCGPSRAGLLTGRYQNRFGFEDNPGPFRQTRDVLVGIPLEQPTLARHLKTLGYTTGMVGKWHEGKDPRVTPPHRGFDETFWFNNGASSYFVGDNPKNMLHRNRTPVAEEAAYLTDAFGREAADFIDRHHDKPFLLYLPFNAVHGPLQAPPELESRFNRIRDPKRRTMAAMLHSMDRNIGRVLDRLRAHQLEERTLVVLLSDNGGKPGGNASLNTPLRGEKGQLYEGGIRIPFCMRWPGRLPAGHSVDFPVISLDIVPTLLAAAGADLPEDLDGINLMPYLDDTDRPAPERTLYWRFLFQWAVRDAEWKLVKTKKDPLQLFRIRDDMTESKDLIDLHPDVARRLQHSYRQWAGQLPAPQWGWQPTFCGNIRVEN